MMTKIVEVRLLATALLVSIASCAFAQLSNNPLKISRLTGDFYVYTTYNTYKGSKVGANGMYVVTSDGVVLIDCPWDTSQFQPLLDTIKARHNKEVVFCIATHFHDDRTAGLEYYSKRGIRTYTTRVTDEWSRKRGMKRAEHLIEKDTSFSIGEYSFQTLYPGPGHTQDNIVIWFPNEKILYGGCLVKSVQDKSLGNLSDANQSTYAGSIANVIRKCKRPRYIIPGHNSWLDNRSLRHTHKLAKRLHSRN